MLDRRRDMVAFAIHTMDTAVSISTNGASNQTQRAINEKPAAVYVLSRCGFGSQMMNLFGHQFYFEVVQKRRFLVDESLYSYRRSEDQGVLTGFFTPDMPVLDRVRDRDTFAQRWLPASENERDPFWAVNNENTDDYQAEIIEEYHVKYLLTIDGYLPENFIKELPIDTVTVFGSYRLFELN